MQAAASIATSAVVTYTFLDCLQAKDLLGEQFKRQLLLDGQVRLMLRVHSTFTNYRLKVAHTWRVTDVQPRLLRHQGRRRQPDGGNASRVLSGQHLGQWLPHHASLLLAPQILKDFDELPEDIRALLDKQDEASDKTRTHKQVGDASLYCASV